MTRISIFMNVFSCHVNRSPVRGRITLDERGGRQSLTYAQLLAEVERIAAGLRGLSIGKGDRRLRTPDPEAVRDGAGDGRHGDPVHVGHVGRR